jgi:hypothetical protein
LLHPWFLKGFRYLPRRRTVVGSFVGSDGAAFSGTDELRAQLRQDVVDALLYLETAPFVTGQILHGDGGASAGVA